MSYRPAFFLKDEKLPDASPKPCLYGEVYATNAEAYQSALSCFHTWAAPTAFTVVESNEPATYQWDATRGPVPRSNEKG
jgi:hypothetical protein